MYFELTEEQYGLQDAVRNALKERWPSTVLARLENDSAALQLDLWQVLSGIGLPGLLVDERYGGAGLELLDVAAVSEVLGEAAAAGPWLGHWLATLALQLAGSEAQKSQWLPKLSSGEVTATVAFGEGEGSWAPSDWSVTVNDGRLNGSKYWVLGGDQAQLAIVGLRDGVLALVALPQVGVEVSVPTLLDLTRPLANMRFIQAEYSLLPGSEDGSVAARLYDAGLALLSADAFGGASHALAMSVDYAKEREQFGRRIGSFQALKHQLANLAVEVEPARGLYWYAAHAWDHIPEQIPRHAALAKAHLAEVFVKVARGAVEVHGGIGYTWEYPLHWWLKRALFDSAYLGSPSLLRQRVAAVSDW